INAVTEGIDALGHASVRVRATGGGGDGRINPQHGSGGSPVFHGHAADTDVVVASTKAYLAALNRLLAAEGGRETTHEPAPSPLETASSGAAEKARGSDARTKANAPSSKRTPRRCATALRGKATRTPARPGSAWGSTSG